MSALQRICTRRTVPFVLILVFFSPLPATVWVVERENPACSNAGPGDATTPFCTLGAGTSAALAGDTVQVFPGTYREQVNVIRSGAPGMPITYSAAGPGVLILGTDDISAPSAWSPTATNAWSRPFAPSAAPTQVFLDGGRLAQAASAGATVTGSFFYDPNAGLLYVDVGGGNPGVGHTVEAGARTYGFRVNNNVSDVVIAGFRMRGQNHTGVRMFPGTTRLVVRENEVSLTGVNGILVDGSVGPLEVRGNDVSQAASVGIRLSGARGVTVDGNRSSRNGFHGFGLATSHMNTLIRNRSWSNARPDVRSANGFNVSTDSDDNRVIANVAWDNQDSGFQMSGGADRTLVARNLSYVNGDHGFDTNGATGTRYVSNTSYGNFKDGFSVEGAAINTSVHNNIGVNNGTTTSEFQLFVDPASVPGFSSDYNLFFRTDSGGRLVKHNGVILDTVNAYAAITGQEMHGLEADPLLKNPASGDFSPGIGPAVDSADASVTGFVLEDLFGKVPSDIETVANSGAGIPNFADRGAIEYVDLPPNAILDLSNVSDRVPMVVVADGSKSRDDVGVVLYIFDFGDGTPRLHQDSPIASRTYTIPGKYTITLTVVDGAGQQNSTSRNINARPPKRR